MWTQLIQTQYNWPFFYDRWASVTTNLGSNGLVCSSLETAVSLKNTAASHIFGLPHLITSDPRGLTALGATIRTFRGYQVEPP